MSSHAASMFWCGWALALLSLAAPAMGRGVFGLQCLFLSFAYWPEFLSKASHSATDAYMLFAAPANLFVYLSPPLLRSRRANGKVAAAGFGVAVAGYIAGVGPVLQIDLEPFTLGYYAWGAGATLIAVALVLRARRTGGTPGTEATTLRDSKAA